MSRRVFAEPERRDAAVLQDLARVRALTGGQIERLHFSGLANATARGSARRRTMRRLEVAGLVTTLPRRVGGERAGSAGLVYALDRRGHAWMLPSADERPRLRRPWPIGWPFVQHTLDVSELYVRLREQERAGLSRLLQFETEPAAWYPTANGVLKPDAWLVYETSDWEHHRWVEADRGTESLPTLERKLRRYQFFAAAGLAGPLGVVPLVLLTVPDERRCTAAQHLVATLPSPAGQLIQIQLFDQCFVDVARPPP